MRATPVVAALLALAAFTPTAAAHRGCHTRTCHQRVGRKARVSAWRAYVRPYRAWLDSTGRCESDSAGGYRLRTTGNGLWFRYQFTATTWRSAGGRVDRRLGPLGIHGELVPSPLEQDVRAVRTLHAQGPGAWPVCAGRS